MALSLLVNARHYGKRLSSRTVGKREIGGVNKVLQFGASFADEPNVRRLLLMLLVATAGQASEVLQISPDGNTVAVSQDAPKYLRVGNYACISHREREMACGLVTKATKKGAIVKLDFRKEDLHKGDKVALSAKPRGGRNVAGSSTVSSYKKPGAYQFALGAGAAVSPSYLLPLFHIQYLINEKISLGIQPGYVGQSVEDTKLSALSFVATVNYYHDGYFTGLWGQVGLGSYFFSITAPDQEEKANAMAAVGTVGYRLSPAPNINLGAAAGLQYISSPTTQTVSFEYSSIQPLAIIEVGVTF